MLFPVKRKKQRFIEPDGRFFAEDRMFCPIFAIPLSAWTVAVEKKHEKNRRFVGGYINKAYICTLERKLIEWLERNAGFDEWNIEFGSIKLDCVRQRKQ